MTVSVLESVGKNINRYRSESMGKSDAFQYGEGKSTSSAVPSAELIQQILNSLDAVVYIADLETDIIVFANNYLKKVFRFDPVGRNCRHLVWVTQEGSGDFCESSRLLNSQGRPGGVVYREYQNPLNKKWYSAKVQAIRWPDGRYMRLVIAQDVTEHKQLQSFLQEARKQAENAISVKNRFVALVAHDLKSPFVSILGMLKRILRKETFKHEIHRKFLENIITNGQRMLRMIDNLLDMDRLQTGKIKPEPCYFDVSKMVDEVFENFAHLAGCKNLRLENIVPSSTEIYADKYLYFVVLNNLISNAVKFSFSEGVIEVSIEEEGGLTRLVVRDHGQGIPENYLKDIFRPDVKTTTVGTCGETGSGLGLVFCQQIMKAHGGIIRIESVEGGGAAFYVELSPSCRLPEPDSSPSSDDGGC